MIIQETKPTYSIECDCCGSKDPLEYDEHSKIGAESQLGENADKLGYSRLFLDQQSMVRAGRTGPKEFCICPLCLRALCATLTKTTETAEKLWQEFAKFMPKHVIDGFAVADRVNAAFAREKARTEKASESTVGLPANTCSLLQNKAEQFSITVTDEMSAALKRLYGQKGTVEDIGLWREVAVKAGVNLPEEANLRPFESVAEEIRKNA